MTSYNPAVSAAFIAAISQMPESWALTPCVGKQNKWTGWNKERLDRETLITAVRSQINNEGKHTAWTGVSLVTGPLSGGVMAIDFDGETALGKYEQLSGGAPLPMTRSWTSGKPGHFQILLRVPQAEWSDLKPLKFHILNAKLRENLGLSQQELADRVSEGVRPKQIADWESGSLQPIPQAIGKKIAEIFGMTDTDPTEKLEFRWNQCSTLPPSIHPDTKAPYYWENWDENYDWENWEEFVPITPDWVLNLMRGTQQPPTTVKQQPQYRQPERQISEILEQDILPILDAESFYGERVKLKKVGNNLVGLCPLHTDKSPSFTVYPESKSFYCFGCQSGGSPVEFLHQIGGRTGSPSGKDFVEVVRQLGDRVGVRIPDLADDRAQLPDYQKQLNHKLQPSSTQLSMEEAAEQAREILKSESDELTTNIKLEKVRQKAGIGDYSWENKIIKPLKRDMDAERFKLELLALLQMEDPVERCRQIALLAPKYSMGAGTLKEAMAAMKQRTQAPEVSVLTLEELFDSESEAIEWLVPGLLPVGETVLLCALPKVGKSKAAVDLAFCVATGESRFLGQKTKQGRVLMITPDASPQSLKQELRKRGFRKQDSQNLHIFPRWSIDQMAVLESELETFRPDLVVIDSLKKITAGKEISENSAEFADNIIALNDMLTRYRAAGILVHHANKGNDAIGVERARGSTAIVGACWGTWMLDRIPKPDPNNKKKLIHDPKCPKRIFTATNRDSEGTTLNIEFNTENNSWDFISEVGMDEEEAAQQQTHRDRILNVLKANSQRQLSGPEIMELLGVTREQRGPIYSELGRMENKRLISSKPAPGDKRFNLYFLPNFEATETTDTVTVADKISLPPPPPTPTVSIANYSSEIHTVHGLENSQQNSQQIVSKNSECDSYKIAETSSAKSINPIVSNFQLSQGGEGVKCTFDSETVTEEKAELSHPVLTVSSKPETAQAALPVAIQESLTAPFPINGQAIRLGRWVSARAIGWNDEGTQLIVQYVQPSGDMGEMLVFPERFAPAEPIALPDNSQQLELTETTEIAQAAPPEPELAEPAPETTPATTPEQEPETTPAIAPADAEKMREIALVWWPELYHPETLQSLVTQMFGWNAPADKYSAEQIAQWLQGEDELVRYRIGEIMVIGLADNCEADAEE
ncbi:MAG TPA: AAA family ATPase [Kamptonema sp.]|nr:AAA family ATPase [Kamptonema sp.]